MDTILVISPGYLDAVKSCLSRYTNFCIAGYSDVSRAIEALHHISGADILGVAYLNDNIREEDSQGLRLLMNKVNIIFQDVLDKDRKNITVPFLYLLSTKTGGSTASSEYIRSLTKEVGINNLKIGYYNFDIATDTLIKVHMFGTILLKRRPFEVTHPEIPETFNNTNHLQVELPFEQKYIDIYEPLSFIEVDDFMVKYSKDRVLCLIRSYLYSRRDNPQASDQIMGDISKALNNMEFRERIPYDSVLRNIDLLKG